jgi:hypothetical protein
MTKPDGEWTDDSESLYSPQEMATPRWAFVLPLYKAIGEEESGIGILDTQPMNP